MKKKRQTQKPVGGVGGNPHWHCECGAKKPLADDDIIVKVGKAAFLKQGCPDCKRPMQFSGNRGEDRELVCS